MTICRFWQAVITFGMGLCIPQNEESLCVDLCRPAWVAAALCNDLYSWDRELKRAQDLGQAEVMNALWVLTHQNGSSINDAKAACRTMIKDSVTQFLQVVHETKCRTDVSNDLKVYVEALQYFVSGNLAWSLTCPKYHEEIDFNEQQRDWLVSGAPESTPVHHGGSQHTIPKETPSIQAIGVLNGDAVPKGDSIRVGSVLEGFNGASISNGGGVTDSHLQTNGHAVPSHLPVPLDTAVDYQCASANSHATSSVHALPHRSPIYNGTTDHEQHSKTADKPVHEDVVLCELPKLDKEVIEAPAQYIKSMPSKGVRSKVIDALNLWLKVPPESLRIVKDITDMLHTASLMLDDFQDGSKLRRGKPSAHTIFGPGPTVNSAFFQFVLAVKETDKLNNPECRKVLLGKITVIINLRVIS